MFRLISVAVLAILVGFATIVVSTVDGDFASAMLGLVFVLLGSAGLLWFESRRRKGAASQDEW